MNGAARSVKNTAKNIALLLLVLLLAVLCGLNWLTGLSVSQMPADSLLRRVYDHVSGGAVGYELRASGIAAAEPIQLALAVDGALSGVQYSLSDIDAGLEAVRPLWAEALSGAGALAEAEESELFSALQNGDCALLRYDGALPLSVIAGWMGGSWKSEQNAQTLLFSAGEGRIYVRTGDGRLLAASAKADAGTLQKAREGFRGFRCEFAGNGYAVYPETLLFEREALSLELMKPEEIRLFDPQSDASVQTVLSAFGYTPYTQPFEEQGGKVEVFVDDISTLRLHEDGLVQYAALGDTGTVLAYDKGELNGHAALDAQLDCARTVLDTAMRAVGAETRASLYAVQREGDTTTLIFAQAYGGVTILGETDFATFVFREGVLSTAAVNLQRFSTDGARRTVMPARQAAAAAAGNGKTSLVVAYREQDGRYVPIRGMVETHE